MKRGQKEGPSEPERIMNCHAKDNIELSVTYAYSTFIMNNRRYRAYTNPGDAKTVGWRDKLHRQLEGAISYVMKHYRYSIINSHKDHIERQIKNCLNENYQQETEPLSDKGLALKTVELIKVADKSGLN